LISQVFSSKEQKYRDMKKPVRREALAISPRLSRILINLSHLKQGDILLDPFCGVGGIIQEALLLGISCIGVDKDNNAIKNAKKNLDWIKKEFKIPIDYRLENLDSKNLPQLNFDGIATESSLGDLIKKKIKEKDADLFLSNFEKLIIPVLRKIRKIKKPKARVAITFPLVKGKGVKIWKILKETDLVIANSENVKFPIREFRNDQFVSREIFVFV
jgi:tRNA G10  N-methylase Trm11